MQERDAAPISDRLVQQARPRCGQPGSATGLLDPIQAGLGQPGCCRRGHSCSDCGDHTWVGDSCYSRGACGDWSGRRDRQNGSEARKTIRRFRSDYLQRELELFAVRIENVASDVLVKARTASGLSCAQSEVARV